MTRRVACRDEDYPELTDAGADDPRFQMLVRAVKQWCEGPPIEWGWLLCEDSWCRSQTAAAKGWVVEFSATPGASIGRVRPPTGKGRRKACMSPTEARVWCERRAREMGFPG